MSNFVPGRSGNPVGRPKGVRSGRSKALAALDAIIGKKRNLAHLSKALETEFKEHPMAFFRTIIMPLLPKESKLEFDPDGVIRWHSLVGSPDERERGPVD